MEFQNNILIWWRETCKSVKNKTLKLFSIRCLHVVHEQGVVSSCRHNPNFDTVVWIPIQKLIVHKNL